MRLGYSLSAAAAVLALAACSPDQGDSMTEDQGAARETASDAAPPTPSTSEARTAR